MAGAQSLVGDGAAGERVAVAINELDRAIRDIRTTLFNLADRRRLAALPRMAEVTGRGGPSIQRQRMWPSARDHGPRDRPESHFRGRRLVPGLTSCLARG